MKRTVLILLAMTAAFYIAAGSKPMDSAGQITIKASVPDTSVKGLTSTSKPGQIVPFGYMADSATTVCAHTKMKITDWQCVSPQDMTGRWYFRIKHKDKAEEPLDVIGLIQSKTQENGFDYYYYYVPLENKGNVVRFTKDGAFIRYLNFPVFGFIFLEVQLEPEIQYMRFPIVTGDTWISKSTGTVELMKLFKVNKQTTTTFTVLGEVDVVINGKIEHVFRIGSEIDKGEGKLDHEEHWYGVNLGLIYQNTEAYTLEIVKYVPGSEINNVYEASVPDSVTPPAKL